MLVGTFGNHEGCVTPRKIATCVRMPSRFVPCVTRGCRHLKCETRPRDALKIATTRSRRRAVKGRAAPWKAATRCCNTTSRRLRGALKIAISPRAC
jgi:hypothetical protein